MNPSPHSASSAQIAILIPCYNEEMTVAKVIRDFRAELPEALIYVFDNASTDRTADLAQEAGAKVFRVNHRGKGNVVQYIYRVVDADICVMVDGDDTYLAREVHELIAPILDTSADMVVGSRLSDKASQFKRLNRIGNYFFVYLLNTIFDVRLTDILSGYRAMNREIFESTPVLSTGFEIETELTIRALEDGFIIKEIPVHLQKRPEGSHSKIQIIRDGTQILTTILALFRDYKPLTFFGLLGSSSILIGILLGIRVINEFLATGLVPRLPTAVLAASLVLLGALLILNGLVLNAVNRRFKELNFQLRRFTRDAHRHES